MSEDEMAVVLFSAERDEVDEIEFETFCDMNGNTVMDFQIFFSAAHRAHRMFL